MTNSSIEYDDNRVRFGNDSSVKKQDNISIIN